MDVCISVQARSHPREQPSCKHFTVKLLEWKQLEVKKLSSLWISMEINNATKRRASERVSEKGWHPQCCCSNAYCFNGFILQSNEAKCILTWRALVCRHRCTSSISQNDPGDRQNIMGIMFSISMLWHSQAINQWPMKIAVICDCWCCSHFNFISKQKFNPWACFPTPELSRASS